MRVRDASRVPGVSVALREHMKTCETCKNSYDKTFDVSIGGTTHTFDSFACAIYALAPHCHQCKARGQYFCCANCARQAGITETVDRASDGGEASP